VIYLSKPFFSQDELDAIRETFDSGWVAGQGPKSAELADFMKSFTGTRHAVPVINCTAGLHLALLAIGTGPGDEVIVSDFTFPATGHAVMYCGAVPRFCDVKTDSYNMDPQRIEELITPKTRALIVVHAFGLMADMDPIREITDRHGLKLIEDAACAVGASYRSRTVGSFGDITCFSFHGRKNVTSGEGGINVTDQDDYGRIMSSLSCFGMRSAYQRQSLFEVPVFETLGFNYKLSDINAAIALVQLKRYPEVLEKKRQLAAVYDGLLKDNEWIIPPLAGKDFMHVYQSYVVLLREPVDRNALIVSLRAEGVQTQIGTYSSHIQPVYGSKDECPNSRHLHNHALALPLYYEMSTGQVSSVVEMLHKHIQIQLTKHSYG
jgi:dTDP-4-amino-4,6-dideoxygalactose transaminase